MLSGLFFNSVEEWSQLLSDVASIFQWFFVPLTLGLSSILVIMETIYVKTGNKFWEKTAKFWMIIFGINFVFGFAFSVINIIFEFESESSWDWWFVESLDIESILVFLIKITFMAVMFFGWNKVSKGFHLASTWLTAFIANMSALWILVANEWMQFPTGMLFYPDTNRSEMVDFWEIAIYKSFYAIMSAYVLSAIVVIGISAWFLLKGREKYFAKNSIVVAAVFGLISSATLLWTVLLTTWQRG